MAAGKTAWVLSGGGSLGAVQVGMLQALSDANLRPDMVIGASVGALNGAAFAADPTPEGVARLATIWRGLRRRDIFPLTLLAGASALISQRDHLVEPEGLRMLIRRSLHVAKIEQTRVPLHVAATDVLSGEEVLLSRGDLEDALMASASIPVVFPPVEIDGRRLVDGGLGANTPIAGAIALGARRIVVLPTGVSCALETPPRNMAALALHMLSLQAMRQMDRDVAQFGRQARIAIAPPLCPLAVSVFDFAHTNTLIEAAAAQTRRWLAEGGLNQDGPLHVPLAHLDHRRGRHGAPQPSGPDHRLAAAV